MANKKINQLDVRTSPSLTDLLAIADPSSGYAYKITGTSLQSLLDVTNRVPYTGATASVNLGEFGLTAGQLTLDTSPTGTAVVGTTQWNDSIGSSQTLLKGGNVLLKNGVDLVARVVNKVSPATTLTKAAYKAVRVSGAQGQRLAIAYAQANTDNNSADTIGLVCETIAANQEGFIITVGQLLDVNTTGSLQGETWADGDVLYLSPTTAGNITNVKPNGSNGHIVVIGYVEYAHAVHGSIYVKTMNGWELDELHNVYISSVANNQVLTYESATDLWKNKSISTILGYTPQAAITLTTTGSSGAATFVSNTLNIPTYTLAGLGGASDSLVMHLAGTETATGVKTFSIGLATTTGDNFMNTSGGNLLVGYSATPATNTYKLNVNGSALITGYLNATNGYLQIFDNDGIYLNANATANGRLKMFGTSTQIWMYNSGTLKTTIASEAGRTLISHSSGQVDLNSSSGLSVYQDGRVSIGGPLSPVNSSLLELYSTSKGLLLPRMTTAQKNAISTPATSLLLYDTDLAAFQYYSGSAWTSLGGGGGISGSGTAGQVTYWSGTSAVTGSSNLFWDNTNGRLGIGTSGPGAKVDINLGAGSITNSVYIRNSSSTGYSSVTLFDDRNSTSYVAQWGLYGTTISGQQSNMYFYNTAGGSISYYIGSGSPSSDLKFRIWNSTGNVTIQNGGTFTDNNYRLDINGTGATAGALRVTGGNVQFGSSTGLNWDNTNFRIGLRTSSPGASIDLWNNGTTENSQLRISDSRVTIPIYSSVGFSPALSSNTLGFLGPSSSSTGGLQFAGFTTNTNTGFPFVFVGYHGGTSPTTPAIKFLGYKHDGSTNRTALTGSEIIASFASGSGSDLLQIKANGRINMSALPTSATGLSTGDLWNNLGVINIV